MQLHVCVCACACVGVFPSISTWGSQYFASMGGVMSFCLYATVFKGKTDTSTKLVTFLMTHTNAKRTNSVPSCFMSTAM